MTIKRADILKFKKENKFVIYPINTLKGGGGKASAPYYIEYDLSDVALAQKLLEALEHSINDAPQPLNPEASHKYYLKSIGVKTMKALHTDSLNVGVFTKDENYYISPTENKGSRQGFRGNIKDRIIISLESSIEELALALNEAFKCSS